MTVLKRYLLGEFIKSLLAVLSVLGIIVLGRLLIDLLNKVVSGKFPPEVIMPLLGLSSIRAMIVLLPLSLLLALMLLMGRMYKDHEITVLRACGLSELRLFRPLMPAIVAYVLLLGGLSIFLNPWAARQVDRMTEEARERVDLKHLSAGRFQDSPLGDWIVYVEGVDQDRDQVSNLFMHSRSDDKPVIETALRGQQIQDPRSNEQALVFNEGYRYEGEPGDADFRVTRFARHITRIPDWKPTVGDAQAKEEPMSVLWKSPDPGYQGEWQWRISTPLSALLLSLIAFPLSHTTPREGRYGKLAVAITFYLVYQNLVLVSVNWVEHKVLPSAVGVWWAHILMLVIGVVLLMRQHAPLKPAGGSSRRA